MFSPSAGEGGPAMATRSRRRQRPKSSESLVQHPKTKRQRVPLVEQTSTNPDAQKEMTEVKNTKIAPLTPKEVNVAKRTKHPVLNTELQVRTKKPKHGERAASRGDGSLVLTSTDAFTMSKLPALPDRIRSDWSGNFHAEISAFGYALTLTPAHAIVWPYNSTSQSPETFTFSLPSASKPSDPLPVGCLVSPSASSSEPGLVVVMAASGKVVFWESIATAATFALMKKDQSDVEHLISGMSSGEVVTGITNAESPGFVLSFNTGRFAYLGVRDGHGRPAISVQFLRMNLAKSGSGIFGSIRNVFSQLSLHSDTTAVRANRSARMGERSVVALTCKRRLQSWRLERGGRFEAIGDFDMRDRLISALRDTDRVARRFPEDSFEAIDCTYIPKGLKPRYLELSRFSDAMASDDAFVQHLLLLVSLTKGKVARYALIEVILTLHDCQVGMIRPITSYSSPSLAIDAVQDVRPRLHLPRPGLVAFIVFSRAIVIASLAIPPESPESQLQIDSHILPASFEDVIDFREDKSHEVFGSEIEEAPAASAAQDENRSARQKAKNPSVVVLVRGVGVIRIVTTDVDKFASDKPPSVSAQSKLEQSVFFRRNKDNPLIFDGSQYLRFSKEEMARAAVDVSHEILSSSTPYISTLPASLTENLRARSQALERLMLHLRAIDADLDRETRWILLLDAEKMHAALDLWKLHEAFTAAREAGKKKSLLAMAVECIHESQKHNPVTDLGELDPIRHWFTNDVFRLEIFVAWAYEVIKLLYKEKLINEAEITHLLHEAIRVNVLAQSSAYDFRRRSLSFYGLTEEQLRMGILRDDFEGIPVPWTGCHFIANNLKRLAELTEQWMQKSGPLRGASKNPKLPDLGILQNIYVDLPLLVDAMLTSTLEYARWALANADNKALAHEFVKTYDAERYHKPLFLAEIGEEEEGAAIAEKHGCLSALAVIFLDQYETLVELLGKPVSPPDAKDLQARLTTKRTKLEDCLSKYGEAFAFPLYEYLLQKRGVAAVLEFPLDSLGFKTRFLRSNPSLARISWINDVQEENDVEHAADTLIDLALNQEDQVWKKKTELSLGRLAILAEAEGKPPANKHQLTVSSDKSQREEKLARVDKELAVLSIQEQLHRQLIPSTYDAVDNAAALNFAMEAHSTSIPRRQKALLQLFRDNLEKLLEHKVLDHLALIDLLTLVSLGPESREEDICPFWLALKVAQCACAAELRSVKKLIWRRLYIRDDWARMNDTQLKVDDEVTEDVSSTELFTMFLDCIRFQDPSDPFRFTPPQEVLGAYTDELDRRFQDAPEGEKSKLIESMRWEDKTLQQYMEKNRLAKWIRSAYEYAQQIASEEADAAT